MFTRLRIVGLGVLGLGLAFSGLHAEGLAIQGTVKGADGKPVKGAEVRVERMDKKAVASSAQTDAKGHYAFNGLAQGSYKVIASTNHGSAASNSIKTRTDGAVRVDFQLTPTTAKANATAKKKRMVWVPSDTGSHVGGRWVEEDAATSNSSTDRIDRANAEEFRKLQGTQPNAIGGR